MGTPRTVTNASRTVKGEPNAIAILPLIPGQYINRLRRFHTAALKSLAQNCLLESELRLVIRVLIIASPAHAKVAATWHNTFRRGSYNLVRLRQRVATLLFHNAHTRLLARKRQWYKCRFAFQSRQKRAAIDRLLNLHESAPNRLRVFQLFVYALHCWLM